MKKAPAVVVLIIIFLSILTATSALAKTVYVRTDGNDASDGLSWPAAKKTVQAGIDAAASGDEVWVAKGTYTGTITHKDGVGLYGGFAGNEETRDQRNWNANKTLLTTGISNAVVSILEGNGTTHLSGFTILGGNIGIFCNNSSPVISDNIITGSASQGIYCHYGAPLLRNNMIVGCGINGIFSIDSSARILANTIAGNGTIEGSAGIDCVRLNSSISLDIRSNIIAFNASGIGIQEGLSVNIKNNCVYNPDGVNYTGITDPTGTDGNISIDPKLVSIQYGQAHIQPDSPCRDAGDDSVADPIDKDIDAESRIIGAHIDIGADESDGTLWTHTPSLVRVKYDGDDANDGSSWDKAKKTVQAAIDAVSLTGGEVWVARGVYYENITLRPYVALYGGFASAESTRDQRDWKNNQTVLHGSQKDSVVRAAGVSADGTIDGFTIRNGKAEDGGGIHCHNYRGSICNNKIINNSSTGSNINGHGGGGISCSGSQLVIRDNTVSGNQSVSYGGGMRCDHSDLDIHRNSIDNNSADRGGGIYVDSALSLRITGNIIKENTAAYYGGVSLNGMSQPGDLWQVENNVISRNHADTCGGIGITGYIDKCTVTDNTIVQNTSASSGAVVVVTFWGTHLSNNIIAFNSSGLDCKGRGLSLSNNCIYNPGGVDYSGVSAGTGDISKDPLFVNLTAGEYHLKSDSPCIDAGKNTDAPAFDIDGMVRPQDGDGDTIAVCDMGAYEYPLSLNLAKKSYPDGTPISFGGPAVTAIFPGSIYVEEASRSTGIRVDTTKTVIEGQVVNVTGVIGTDASTGERYVSASSPFPETTGTSLSLNPLYMSGCSLGGGACGLQDAVWSWRWTEIPGDGLEARWLAAEGLNNIGLLVRVSGKVTQIDPAGCYFYIDDGSGVMDGTLTDGSPNWGIRVALDGRSYQQGDYLTITGISSCFKGVDGKLRRLLKVRRQEDAITAGSN